MRLGLAALALGALVLGLVLAMNHGAGPARAAREAEEPPPAEVAPPVVGTARIVGTIRNERGEGVPGAGVAAEDSAGNRRNADVAADGTYLFEDLGPGRYRVTAWTPGHWRPRPADVDAPAGGEARCDFVAHRGWSLRGRVQDRRDHAVEGIDIRPFFNADQIAISDAKGAFDLGGFYSDFGSVGVVVRDPKGRYTPWEGDAFEGVVITLDDGATLEGIVVRRETGAPVADAKLRLREEKYFPEVVEATSGDDGKFRIAGRPAGRAVLEATAADLAPARIQLDLPAGNTTPVRIELGAGGSVDVTVLDPDGRPVPGAKIMPAENLFALWYVGPAPDVRTGPDGRAVLEHVEPGRRRIAAASDDFLPAVAPVEVPGDGMRASLTLSLGRGGAIEGRAPRMVLVMSEDLAVYREATPAADGAYRVAGLPAGAYQVVGCGHTVSVIEGETTRCDFDATGGAIIRGRALIGGVPAESGLCLVSRDSGLVRFGQLTRPDAEGRFVVQNVPPGAYDLVLEGHGHRALDVPADATDVTADILLPGKTLAGRVVDPGGQGVSAAHVLAVAKDLMRDHDLAELTAALAETSADGSFSLTLDEGEFFLTAWSEKPERRASAGPFPAGMVKPVELRLGGGRIRARVAGPDGFPARAVLVTAIDPAGPAVAQEFGDGLGLALSGVPAGVYDILAVLPRGGFARAKGVRVTEGQTTEVSLAVGDGGAVEVAVGASKVGARVLVTLPDGSGVPGAMDPHRFKGPPSNLLFHRRVAAATDANGVARIDGLSAGEYRGRAETGDGRTAELTFTIRDGETTCVRCDLTR